MKCYGYKPYCDVCYLYDCRCTPQPVHNCSYCVTCLQKMVGELKKEKDAIELKYSKLVNEINTSAGRCCQIITGQL
jgi:phosphotransferase system IIB component